VDKLQLPNNGTGLILLLCTPGENDFGTALFFGRELDAVAKEKLLNHLTYKVANWFGDYYNVIHAFRKKQQEQYQGVVRRGIEQLTRSI
jgi:hypothetical protein